MARLVSRWSLSSPALPWAGAVLAAAVLVVWLWAPVRTPVALRVPGADRPAGQTAVGGGDGDPFAAARLVSGPGKPGPDSGAWPRFRGPDLDGISRESTPLLRSWPESGPRREWETEVGEGFAGPVIAGGRVYLMDYDRDQQRDALRCLSLSDGAEIWRFSYPVSIKRNHGLTRTVPTVAGGRVVAMGPKCHVIVVDAETGRFHWGIDLVRDFGATVPPWYTGQCPLVDGDTVILAPGGPTALLAGVDIATGKERWRTPNSHDWKMTHSSVVPFEVGGTRYFLYCASGGVVAVHAADGSVAWDSAAWKINIATVPTPVLAGDGRVFLTGGYNAGSLMLEFRRDDGVLRAREVFRLKASVFGATQHSPVWRGDHLYGIRADGRLVCLSGEGKVVWESEPGVNLGLGPLMIAGDLLYALNDGGRLYLVEATPDAYRPLAEAQIIDGHECWAPLALAGGRLLARDLTRLLCLQAGVAGDR